MPDLVTSIAASEYARRSDSAKRLVAAGTIPADAAQRELLPWKAIAVLCSVPRLLAAEIADYRRTIVYYRGDGSPAVYGHLSSESAVRAELAAELCPSRIWRAALSKARDVALGKADTPERIERARELSLLALAFGVPLTAASCARPAQIERKAA